MAKPLPIDHKLPSRELSYAYAVAMYFAQQLELNLRAFLYTADYHGWIDIPLTEEQQKRYKAPRRLYRQVHLRLTA
jgi:hypothetical protein